MGNLRDEYAALQGLVEKMVQEFSRRRSHNLTGVWGWRPKFDRLNSYSQALAEVKDLHRLLRGYTTRVRQLSAANDAIDVAQRILNAVLRECIIRNGATVYEQGLRRWKIVEGAFGVEKTIAEFADYIERGIIFIRLGYRFARGPFYVIRNERGLTPARLELAEGICEDFDGFLFTEARIEDEAQLPAAIDRMLVTMQHMLVAAILSMPGYVRRIPPSVVRGRCWEWWDVPEQYRKLAPASTIVERLYRTKAAFGLADLSHARLDIEDDADRFRETYHSVVNGIERLKPQNKKRFCAAFERFAEASERVKARDRLVDCLVVLETLLLDGAFELSFRVALLACELVGGDADQRQEVFDCIRCSYDVRSAAVHRGDVREAPETAERCWQVCCSVWREFIKLGCACRSVPEELLSRLVRGQHGP